MKDGGEHWMERCLGQGVGKACGSPRQAPASQHLHVLSLEGLWTLYFWGFVESAPRGHGVLPSVQEGGVDSSITAWFSW